LRSLASAQLIVRGRGPVAPTVIRNLTTGQVTATLGPVQVQAFSGDDNLVIATSEQGAELIRWRTAESLAHLPRFVQVAAYQPDGESFMVKEIRPGGGLLIHDRWLVSGDGSSRVVARNIGQFYSPSGQ
jgi:hypothetical protein